MPITIKDVAKKAGVSPTTVSFVLNKKKGITKKTIKKVENAIRELNYYPTRSARSLITHKTMNLGFILSEKHFSIADPFYTRILLGAEFEARKYNYYVLLTSTETDFAKEESLPQFIVERNVDGVMIAGSVDDSLIHHIQETGIPLVLIDYLPMKGEVTAVLLDNIRGAYEAVTHLIKLGHKNIGFIGGSFNNPNIKERFFGYQQALEEFSLKKNDAFVVTDEPSSVMENGINAIHKLLKQSFMPSAIFVANDAQAIGCIKALKGSGLKVPEDVAVMGFDDVEGGLFIEPQLSTMRVLKEEMGALAVKKIISIIENPSANVDKTLVRVELVIRESCGGKAAD